MLNTVVTAINHDQKLLVKSAIVYLPALTVSICAFIFVKWNVGLLIKVFFIFRHNPYDYSYEYDKYREGPQ